MLSPNSLQAIEASQGWRQHRVEMFDLPEGRVVVKGQRSARGPWRFRVLSALARLTSNPLLRPVPAPGGAAAQATEVARLRSLAASGVQVPELMHQGADYIVLRRIEGQPLQDQFTGEVGVALRAFTQGLDGLIDLHRRGQYLSQGFARNMLAAPDGLWYIDFEDDPLQVMDLPDAQARDLLSYLLSAVWINRASRADLMSVWSATARSVAPDVMQRVRVAASGLSWLRRLPRERKPWGRDVVTVQALAEFLYHWNTSEPALS